VNLAPESPIYLYLLYFKCGNPSFPSFNLFSSFELCQLYSSWPTSVSLPMRLLLPPYFLWHPLRTLIGICVSSSRHSATVISLDSPPVNYPSHLNWSSAPRRARASIAACTTFYMSFILNIHCKTTTPRGSMQKWRRRGGYGQTDLIQLRGLHLCVPYITAKPHLRK
jgi:hypothetical protein